MLLCGCAPITLAFLLWLGCFVTWHHPALDLDARLPPQRLPLRPSETPAPRAGNEPAARDLRRKLLLHVGPHKTATTTFQESMLECVQRKLYPAADYFRGCTGNIPHTRFHKYVLAWPLEKRSSKKEKCVREFEAWSKIASSARVVSGEVSCCISYETKVHLRLLFALHETTVVWVHRNHVSRSISLYTEVNKRLHSAWPLLDWLRAPPETEGVHKADAALGSEQENLADYVKIFGRARVKVLDYDGALAAGQQLHHAILAAAGLPVPLPEACTRKEKSNPSPHDLDPQLMNTAFDRYLKQRKCHFKDPAAAPEVLKKLLQAKEERPRVCHPLAKFLESATEFEGRFRAAFGDLFLFQNLSAMRAAMRQKLPFCELDVEKILATWNTTHLQAQFHKLRHQLQCSA